MERPPGRSPVCRFAGARPRLAPAESERDGLKDEVRFAVESGVQRTEEARRVLQLDDSRLLLAARERVEAPRVGLETGRSSFLALIEAKRSLRTTRLGYGEALAVVGRRTAELERAVRPTAGLRGSTAP